MTKNAVADRKRQVETAPIRSRWSTTRRLCSLCRKPGKASARAVSPAWPKRMTEIVAETDRLDEVLVEEERPADSAGNLGHLEGVGEAGPVVVTGGSDKDLGLVHQPAKTLGVEDTVAVALERGAQVALWFRRGAVAPAARRATGRG